MLLHWQIETRLWIFWQQCRREIQSAMNSIAVKTLIKSAIKTKMPLAKKKEQAFNLGVRINDLCNPNKNNCDFDDCPELTENFHL
jgi:hypothetical protein